MLAGRLGRTLRRVRGVLSECTAARDLTRTIAFTRSVCTKVEEVEFIFVEDGEDIAVSAPEGKTLLEVAHANDVDLEGACDGSLACSTCHVILEQHVFDKLPPPEEDELDMLDLAFDLTETSRLGCQIKLGKELAGMRATIPNGV
uniref:2Fe-2S ferredoxin-type domain-containing protein n=1 Tax=Coccolithus braarudii TaxID=221442 RepID=A0A7S0LJQ5_9EUKA|mmetsp:Transcript_41966/g.89593  ORF Transcript_41966/g.89593 Transcript_41966/m.89593 type:complete len:145 (+) Transcript_41966:117-551(+)